MLVRTAFGVMVFDYLDNKCIRAEFLRKDFLAGDAELIAKQSPVLDFDSLQKLIHSQEYLLAGTEFEIKTWRAIQNIPVGETRTYQEIALEVGSPKAARAVGTACAKNRLALIVPCHRVVSKSGEGNSYRWGSDLKFELLKAEREQQHSHMLASLPG